MQPQVEVAHHPPLAQDLHEAPAVARPPRRPIPVEVLPITCLRRIPNVRINRNGFARDSSGPGSGSGARLMGGIPSALGVALCGPS